MDAIPDDRGVGFAGCVLVAAKYFRPSSRQDRPASRGCADDRPLRGRPAAESALAGWQPAQAVEGPGGHGDICGRNHLLASPQRLPAAPGGAGCRRCRRCPCRGRRGRRLAPPQTDTACTTDSVTGGRCLQRCWGWSGTHIGNNTTNSTSARISTRLLSRCTTTPHPGPSFTRGMRRS